MIKVIVTDAIAALVLNRGHLRDRQVQFVRDPQNPGRTGQPIDGSFFGFFHG
jgi:hypothetical protein